MESAFEALQQCLAEHQDVSQVATHTNEEAALKHQQPSQASGVAQRVSSQDVMISLRRVRNCHGISRSLPGHALACALRVPPGRGWMYLIY
jgi:hypothetical protein